VIAHTLSGEQLSDLREEFETIDTDGSGEITFAELKQVTYL